ncbi:putative ATP:guanido phosphotransferase [Candidatus Vecturithrix granuli]|uniref:Putative ATP:guanido phosphotransferase n=1 Tax=Vecturithrix granuli TaxID=1499967 RepID=A0A081C063_VECG1|nr:putative ATP:guanido phosphotransferase [Candidatus Vecturithrix granuli]
MKLLPYVISSRVRLARNIKQHRFPHAASTEERQAVCECICRIVRTNPRFQGAELIEIDGLTPLERKVLEEQYVISHTFASQGSSRLLVLQKAQNTSILVNEEDHLRIQGFSSGFHLQEAWQRARQVETSLEECLDFAYADPYGYLTTCPRNAGLGLRASVLMFIPGILMLKRMRPLINHCISAGYTLRGMYGEGSESQGYLLQISNQRAEERNALRLLEDLQTMCHRIILQEQRARTYLLRNSARIFRKEFERARVLLCTAQALDVPAAMQILGIYRLGISSGTIPVVPLFRHKKLQRIDQLFIQIQPAHIYQYVLQHDYAASSCGYNLQNDHPDIIRATLMRQSLTNTQL